MSFLVYLLKAEPMNATDFETMLYDCVFPLPCHTIVHPSLPPGHYYLYGCFPGTLFNFNKHIKKQYANYTATEVTQEDFITEITTNATAQAIIERNTSEVHKGDESTSVYTFYNNNNRFTPNCMPFVDQFLEDGAARGSRKLVTIDANRPLFVRSNDPAHQPFGFCLDYSVFVNDEHPDTPLWDQVAIGQPIAPPPGHLFHLFFADQAETNTQDCLSDAIGCTEHRDISDYIDYLGFDMNGQNIYKDTRSYCSLPTVDGASTVDLSLQLYTKAINSISRLTSIFPFHILQPKTAKLRMDFIQSFTQLAPSRQALTIINSIARNSGVEQTLKFVYHMIMYHSIPDETIFHILKWICIDNDQSLRDHTWNIMENIIHGRPNLLLIRRPIRIPPMSGIHVSNFGSQYPPNESSKHPTYNMSLAELACYVENNGILEITVGSSYTGEPFPTTMDTLLRFPIITYGAELLIDRNPHYFERNPEARPLWSLAHNFSLNGPDKERDMAEFLRVIARLKKMPGFSSKIPHFPTIEDLCIINAKYSLYNTIKAHGINIQVREPHCAELPDCCSALGIIITAMAPALLKDYHQCFTQASHHVSDRLIIDSVNLFGFRVYPLYTIRFKDSSWPLYLRGTKIPFVSLIYKIMDIEDFVTMLNLPGLPLVDKMVINMIHWYEFLPKGIKVAKPDFETGTLLDVYLMVGSIKAIKHLISTYGVQWITKQTETLIQKRSQAEQKVIKSLVADHRLIMGLDTKIRGGGGKSLSSSKKKTGKTKATLSHAQSQSLPLQNDDATTMDQTKKEDIEVVVDSLADTHIQSQAQSIITTSTTYSSIQPPPPVIQIEQYERTVGKFKFSRKTIIGRGSNGTLVYKGVCVTDNLVRFFGMEENDDYFYLATSLCEMSLQELVEAHIDRFKSLDEQTLINDIVNGVRFLHNNNIIHNDLNPRNILFKDNHLFITDMGLSKMSVETSFAFTHAPSGQGGYFPAEVINNQRKTNSVDIFALGCLMYYILTDGGHPFGDNQHIRAFKILHNEFNINQLTDQPCVTDLIKQMISLDSSSRPTINMVINHPFFWDINKRIMFINRVFQTIQNQPHSYLNKVIVNQWNKSIDSRLLDQLESQYNYNSAKDLIRCIRNTTQHHHQLFKDAQKKTLFFDSQQSAFQYFEQRHPTLIVQLYRRFINTDDASSDNLKDYFVS
ncbi:hypothetical protein SAMD00019534_033560 [Acytostelium subglobosum LB1]|uniref:hypothetical protein n=1 Tax=Acytostelium subglobosum LB1 TaxID=1410327 RepID=UPI000644A8CB|nr:hypothetical protein SAMD00019534_033560 [Acytostelium subglobosum LB1]GAM20181.1 hypothetical protein SAMD00019534_033560 [Acytostelium subglobosum LB1]|eukprot:XP_012759702.1 hypothetical protein SAMD00019534_033560 [Acytostelium subglobosum LB1]